MTSQFENVRFRGLDDGTLDMRAEQNDFRIFVQSWDKNAACAVSWDTDGDQSALRSYLQSLPTAGIYNVDIWDSTRRVIFGEVAPGDRAFADDEDVRPLNAFKTFLKDDQVPLLVRIVSAEYIMFWQSHPHTGVAASIQMTSDASITQPIFENFARLTLPEERIPKFLGAIVSANSYVLSELEANQASFLSN